MSKRLGGIKGCKYKTSVFTTGSSVVCECHTNAVTSRFRFTRPPLVLLHYYYFILYALLVLRRACSVREVSSPFNELRSCKHKSIHPYTRTAHEAYTHIYIYIYVQSEYYMI